MFLCGKAAEEIIKHSLAAARHLGGLCAAFFGKEHMHNATVGFIVFPAHEVLGFQLVYQFAHRRRADVQQVHERFLRDAVLPQQSGQQTPLPTRHRGTEGTALPLHKTAAVYQVGTVMYLGKQSGLYTFIHINYPFLLY